MDSEKADEVDVDSDLVGADPMECGVVEEVKVEVTGDDVGSLGELESLLVTVMVLLAAFVRAVVDKVLIVDGKGV